MNPTSTQWKPGDIVPLADRQRYMMGFRVLAAGLALLFAGLGWAGSTTDFAELALVSGAYLGLSLVATFVWFRIGGRGLFLFGAMLITDGVYLAWTVFVTGGMASTLRFLILLQLIAVALLASHRTALKLAIWHSILQFLVLYAEQGGVLHPVAGDPYTSSSTLLLIAPFVVIVWLVTLSTAAFSAVNERELRRRRYDLEALAKLAGALESVTDEAELGEALLAQIGDTFGIERSVLVGLPSGTPVVLAARGAIGDRDTDVPIVSHPLLAQVRRERSTLLVSHIPSRTDPWLAQLMLTAHNVALVPLTAEGQCMAVLLVEHGMRHGSRMERRVLSMVERFAGHAALALKNVDLMTRMRAMASTDSLTGLANRRSLETVLERELTRADRTGTTVSVVMIDIDHFKQLNDAFGHQAGDQVLREVGCALALSCRDFDTAARYGGEEFTLVLPTCGPDSAAVAAERLRRDLRAIKTVAADITASAGVATYPVDARDAESLIKAADDALYLAKQSGRDRVVSAPHLEGLHVVESRRQSA